MTDVMEDYRSILLECRNLQSLIATTINSVTEEVTTRPRSTRGTQSVKKSGTDAKITKAKVDDLNILSKRMRRVYELVFKLTQLRAAAPFLYPVKQMYQPSELPLYDKIVTRPMDLNTVLEKVLRGDYNESEDAVLSDLNLIWENCRMYLGPKHPLAANALTCREEMETLWRTIRTQTSSPYMSQPAAATAARTPANQSLYDEEEKVSTHRAAPQVVDETMRHSLMESIAELYDANVDAMTEVIDLIQVEAPNCLQTSSEGTDLNLEPLSDYAAYQKIRTAVLSRLENTRKKRRMT